jgi:hypothetical protein
LEIARPQAGGCGIAEVFADPELSLIVVEVDDWHGTSEAAYVFAYLVLRRDKGGYDSESKDF